MNNFWRGKKVLITGHSGFKGSWLSIWLKSMGASVIGFSLHNDEKASWIFRGFNEKEGSYQGDILNPSQIKQVFEIEKPDVVFHLAAQALVQESYKNPKETWDVNVMGSLNVLQACTEQKSVKVVVVATTDKCYQNKGWDWGYRENDELGGKDPYSASKAALELLVESWRQSFKRDDLKIATARAGNVIGGGDGAENRIVPDIMKAWSASKSVMIRNLNATRPYQHVLEPLRGYMMLAQAAWEQGVEGAFNFGPDQGGDVTNHFLLEQAKNAWKDPLNIEPWVESQDKMGKEAHLLMLDSSKAKKQLKWNPIWNSKDSIEKTVDWYCNFHKELAKEGMSLLQWASLVRDKNDQKIKLAIDFAEKLAIHQIQDYEQHLKKD